MLCESKIINKNPKYRIIKYNDEYLMIDIISTWISLFFPFINWFITKRYVKISREEFENLNIVKPAKKNVFWPVAGISTLFAVTLRKYTHLLDTQLDKKLVIAICCITLFGYVFLIFWTVIFSYALLSMSYQNIIVYFAWITAIMVFFLVNIALIIDKNIHVILKN